MKTIGKVIIPIVLFILSISADAQNGPGGIGNLDGSNGEPVLKFWLMPDSLSLTEGDDVLSWTDHSGNGYDFSAASATSPIFRSNALNGHDYLEFSKVNNRIVRNPFDMPTSAVAVFMVLKTSDSGDGLVSYNAAGADNEYLYYQSNNQTTWIGGSANNIGTNFSDGNWKIFAHQWRNIDGRLYLHINGTEEANITHRSGYTITENGALAIAGEQDAVDGNYDAGQAFQGDIAEVIMYGSSLLQADRVVIENYLAQKYGLDVNLLVDRFDPPDASYIVDMSGVGKEADGVNELNSAGLVVNENGSFVNGDYIFAAHDGTANSINTSPSVSDPSVLSAWSRNWYLEKSGTAVDAKIAFDFSEGIDGDYPSNITNYRLLYKANPGDQYQVVTTASTGVQNGDQVYFAVTDANIANGYYTIGTINETDSPLDGLPARTWYTLISGDWDNWETWTLDPSGALPNNPDQATPMDDPIDRVVILSGRTVTVNSNNLQNTYLKIDGELNLQNYTGHSFYEIEGSGRLVLAGDNFPSGNATHFTSAGEGEGTVVYTGNSYNLSQPLSFYNLNISLNNITDKLTLLADYDIAGDFKVDTGAFQINDNSSTTNLNIAVQGDVSINETGKLLTGTGNARHQFNFYGDLTNNGLLEFTNRTTADYNNEALDGIVDANFLNDFENQTVVCDNTSNFYRIEINKGTDDTYELKLIANDPSYFNLYGYANEGHGDVAQLADNANALGLIKGTVRISTNVNIPVLNNTGNYNVSEAARLWVDGGNVAKDDGTAIVPYGKVLVTRGTLEATVNSGITTRVNGLVKVEGGTLSINQLRTSVYGAENVGGYVQSGGTTNILGGNTNADYYAFNLTYEGNVFSMSGGTLHIHDAPGKGGIFIASNETNQSITGGTVVMEISDGNDFEITSKAPFWDVIIRNSFSGTGKHILTNGVDVGATNENLAVQDLVVLNDLTIETGTTRSDGTNTYGSYLDLVPDNATPANLYVGANLTIEDNAVLDIWGWTGTDNSTSATLYFNSSKDAVFFIGDITSYTNALLEYESPNISDGGPDGNFPTAGTGEMHTWKYNLPLYNLVVDKPDGKLSLAANSPGKGDDWANAAGQAGNWVLSNGGKNTQRWLSQLLSIKNQFKLLNGTFSQIDPYNTVTIVENGGATYGSVGDPVGYSVNLYTTDVEIRDTMFVYEAGTTPKEGIIEVRAPNPLNLQTTDDAFIGNMRFIDDHNNPVTLVSDVHFGRIEYFNGTIDIGTHNLKIDLFETYAVDHPDRMDAVSTGQPVFGVPNFIRMAGNASDGGISLKVPKNPTWPLPNNDEFEYLLNDWDEEQGPYAFPDRLWFPIGTDASGTDKYTPAVCRLQNYGTTDGDEYITVRVVDQELQTTDLTGGDVLSYYWNVDFEGYATGEEPTVSWVFQYDDSDLDVGVGDETAFVPGKVLDGGAYTRSDEGGVAAVKNGGASTIEGNILGNDPANIVIFNGTGTSGSTDPDDNIETISSTMFNEDATGPNINANWQNAWPNVGLTLENANYTAGEANRFVGQPAVFYNQRGGPWDGRDWGATDSWYDTPEGTNHPSSVPGAGDIVVIRGNYIDGSDDAITVNGTREVAEVIFQREGTYSDIESLPRLRLETTDQLTAGKISGVGDLYLRKTTTGGSILNADIGEFAANDTSMIEFYMTENGTYDVAEADFFTNMPTLRVYGQNSGQNNRKARFNYDFQCKNLIVDGQAQLLIGGNYTVENKTRLGFTSYGSIEFPAGSNAYTLETTDFYTGNGKNQDDLNLQQVTVETGFSNFEHRLIVKRNIEFDFYDSENAADNVVFDLDNGQTNNRVILELHGDEDGSFVNNFSAANFTIELYKIYMNKGTDSTSTFRIDTDFDLLGSTAGIGIDKAITLKNGALILNNGDIEVDLNTGGDDFVIPSSSALILNAGKAFVNGNSGILLDGLLKINGGQLDMRGGDNYIEYSASGNAQLDVVADTLFVGSQIRRGLTATEGILKYAQSGGVVIVGTDDAPENNRGVLEVLNGSEFNLTDGKLIIARAQDNPSIASLYLDPDNYNLADDGRVYLGYTSTPSNQKIGVYSTIDIPYLRIDNTSGQMPTVKQWVLPLTVTDSLIIEAGAELNAAGRDLFIKGHMIVNGAFTPNANTTYFNGASPQEITGSATFYNLNKSTATNLSLNDDITVSNNFTMPSGTFVDNNNTLNIEGNIAFGGTHTWGGSGNGIVLNGGSQQIMTGAGTYGLLTLDNPEGVSIDPNGGSGITVADMLKLESGVFDIDKFLLTVKETAEITTSNSFDENTLIQTNISFIDAGILKELPAVSTTTSYVFPVGVKGKYTPVTFNIDAVDAGGQIRVKAANEMHPTIIDDNDEGNEFIDSLNVLQYHWIVEATDITNFTADLTMQFDPEDAITEASPSGGVAYDTSDYIAARILTYGDNTWNKYDYESFEGNDVNALKFSFAATDDLGISGDYTAGVEQVTNGAIPNQVTEYITTEVNSSWNDATNWALYDSDAGTAGTPGDNVPASGPRGAIVYVEANHTLTVPNNYISAYKTQIKSGATLNLGTTYGHRLGIVSGTGTLYLENGALPAGIYDSFFATTGGTLHYNGGSYTMAGISSVNNLIISGANFKDFPNNNVTVSGDFLIDGGYMRQNNSRAVTLLGDLEITSGQMRFDVEAGNEFIFAGSTDQNVIGEFATINQRAFNNVVVNKPAGDLILNNNVLVEASLDLQNGIVNTGSTNTFNLTTSATVSGGSSSSYINGPLIKSLNSSTDVSFPVGKNGLYRPVAIQNPAQPGDWTAEYFANNSTSTLASGLSSVSGDNRWVVTGDYSTASQSAKVKLTWGPETNVSTNTADYAELRVAYLDGGQWTNAGNSSYNGTQSSGYVISDAVSFSTKEFTIASATTDNPLPVSLIDFDATVTDNKVKVSWQTLNELNNDYFVVERSQDGVVFESVGRVQGAGNSSSVLNYAFTDTDPYYGISYYRLRQVDYDGSETVFPMVVVEITGIALDEPRLNIHPNPYREGDIIADIGGFNTELKATVMLADVSGNAIWQSRVKPTREYLSEELGQQLSLVQPGFYVVVIVSNQRKVSARIIKK